LSRAEHMRQELERSAEAVVRILVDEAAECRQEAPHLRARIVEHAGRAPALRAAHDRSVAVVALDARELAGDEIERALPRYRHEALAAAGVGAARPVLEIAFAHHRAGDAGRRIDRRRHRLDQRRWIGIAWERLDADEAAVLDLGEERAPVRMMRDKPSGHGSP